MSDCDSSRVTKNRDSSQFVIDSLTQVTLSLLPKPMLIKVSSRLVSKDICDYHYIRILGL